MQVTFPFTTSTEKGKVKFFIDIAHVQSNIFSLNEAPLHLLTCSFTFVLFSSGTDAYLHLSRLGDSEEPLP